MYYDRRGKTTTSCAQNEPDAAVGCSSSAPRWRFLPSVAPLLYAASASDDRRIRCPEILETVTSTIPAWDGLPQPLTRLCSPIPHNIGEHLTCLAAPYNPTPGVVRFFEHKRPPFVQLQDRRSGIFWVRSEQGGASRRKLVSFFDPNGHACA